MRILKGYSKDEQKELEDAKRKYMNGGDLFHIITGFLPDTRCGLIWKKQDKADKDERISIIKDILDFYNGKAKFTGSKKYYVHLINGNDYSYLNISLYGASKLVQNNPIFIILTIVIYFTILFGISYFSGRKADNAGFFFDHFGVLGDFRPGLGWFGRVQASLFKDFRIIIKHRDTDRIR